MYEIMADLGEWGMLRSLLGGTRAMRDAGQVFLPKEQAEKDPAYNNRLNRSFLFNAFKDTIIKVGNKPFTKPVTLQGDLPDQRLKDIEDDVDLQGTTVTEYSKKILKSALTYGIVHTFVDFPVVPEGISLAEENEINARPFWRIVEAPDLIGWQFERGPNGAPELTMIRMRETRVESAGTYVDKNVEFIRVVTKEAFEVWRFFDTDELKEMGIDAEEGFKMVEQGEHNFGRVPLNTLYISQTGFLTAEPPFIDLAWKNVEHWQSASDQNNILKIMRIAILFATGFSDETIDKGLTIGADQLVATSSPEASLEYVEHTGKGTEAGDKHIEQTKDDMVTLGGTPNISSRSGNVTATGRAIDESKSQTPLQAAARLTEIHLSENMDTSGEWIDQEIPEDTKFNIDNDFRLHLGDNKDNDDLKEARKLGLISQETYLIEIRKRGLIGETVDIVEEMDRIEQEGPPLASVTAFPPAPPTPPDDGADPDEGDKAA